MLKILSTNLVLALMAVMAEASTNSFYFKAGALDALGKEQLCSDMDRIYRKQKWDKASICEKIPFKVFGYSVEGRPLVYFDTGTPDSKKLSIIQCGIHGDELPSLPMCLNLIAEILAGKNKIPPGTRLVVQPLLNPDGMFSGKSQRPNARGVDLNRNFSTHDWVSMAQEVWRKRDKSDLRKFPGSASNSEPETQAISRFIEKEKPQKILSIHTPLGFLDLDSNGKDEQERRAKFLAINMSKNSGNYTFKRFGFFPGSLGNWAGRERQIPVYTLELPSGDSLYTIDSYWKRFRVALWRAIEFDLDTGQFFED